MIKIFDSLMKTKQIILYGPPGTSKTYYAKEIAKVITKHNNNIEFVQFHPSYSYEDFVEGIFPELDESGNIRFEIKSKTFRKICDEAIEKEKLNYVLIIDEINRSDLSKVFGEIFSALEYRKEEVKLLYSQRPLIIPPNLYIIGTMNKLDKSTIDVDFALMRRFRFIEIGPDKDILENLLKNNKAEDELINKITLVFNAIQDYFKLGHAYFKDVKSEDDLKSLWDYQLSFLFKEYFADLKQEDFDKINQLYHEGLGIED